MMREGRRTFTAFGTPLSPILPTVECTPKTAQQLARHSTITLTMDRYSHTIRGQLATALDVLPDLPQTTQNGASKRGTDDVNPALSTSKRRKKAG